MPKPSRLTEASAFPELEVVEREATPQPAMEFGIQLHLTGLSLSDTVSVLNGLRVEHCRTTVHNWVQKTGLQPTEGCIPNHVAVDETVIQVANPRY